MLPDIIIQSANRLLTPTQITILSKTIQQNVIRGLKKIFKNCRPYATCILTRCSHLLRSQRASIEKCCENDIIHVTCCKIKTFCHKNNYEYKFYVNFPMLYAMMHYMFDMESSVNCHTSNSNKQNHVSILKLVLLYPCTSELHFCDDG